jgi:hypothetical protein
LYFCFFYYFGKLSRLASFPVVIMDGWNLQKIEQWFEKSVHIFQVLAYVWTNLELVVNGIDNELRWLNVATPWLRGAMVELHEGHRRNFFLVVLRKNLGSELRHVTMLVFVLYLRRLFMTLKGFCSPQEVYGIRLVFSLRRVLHVPHLCLVPTIHGKIFWPLVFVDV